MNGASKMILSGLAVVAAFLMGYDTGEQRALHLERSLHDWSGSVMQARDAAKRWAIKNREPVSVAMEHRYSRYMAFPDKNCIELRLTGGVGGVPIYCYRANTVTLVEKYSEVE